MQQSDTEKKFAIFSSLPIPPSSNNQYYLKEEAGKTRHKASAELRAYREKMDLYPHTQPASFLMQKHLVQGWVNEGYLLEVKALFCFKRKRIFTLENNPKRLDVSNRLKALHDCLGRLLGIDDCLFFKIQAEKALCDENLNEMVLVEISPIL